MLNPMILRIDKPYYTILCQISNSFSLKFENPADIFPVISYAFITHIRIKKIAAAGIAGGRKRYRS